MTYSCFFEPFSNPQFQLLCEFSVFSSLDFAGLLLENVDKLILKARLRIFPERVNVIDVVFNLPIQVVFEYALDSLLVPFCQPRFRISSL